tara:strand:+ start:216 stop:407 length:192 start_codon:yes stop_codon:yes gene_type:complete
MKKIYLISTIILIFTILSCSTPDKTTSFECDIEIIHTVRSSDTISIDSVLIDTLYKKNYEKIN